MMRDRVDTLAELHAASLRAMRNEIRRLRRLRAFERTLSGPRAILMTRRNLPILNRLYPGFDFNAIKAVFPLRKIGTGPGTRYVLIPREVDRWLDELPHA